MDLLIRKSWQRLTRAYGVRANVTFGPDLHLGAGSVLWAPQKLTLGRGVYIGKGCTIEADGTIGDYCMIGNRVGIVGATDHDMTKIGMPIRKAPWVGDAPARLSREFAIGHDVWIGFGAVILSGVSISRGAVIAAGAVVTHDVGPYEIVAGNPARRIRKRFEGEQIVQHEAELEHRFGIRPSTSLPR